MIRISNKTKGRLKKMTVKERILTIRLIEKAKKDPSYAKKLGVEIINENRKKER